MKKFYYFLGIIFIITFYGCSKDYTNIGNLVDTKWKCNDTKDVEIEYYEFHFISETSVDLITKLYKDKNPVSANIADYIVDEDQISFYYDGDSAGTGTIDGTTMTILGGGNGGTVLVFELQ